MNESEKEARRVYVMEQVRAGKITIPQRQKFSASVIAKFNVSTFHKYDFSVSEPNPLKQGLYMSDCVLLTRKEP